MARWPLAPSPANLTNQPCQFLQKGRLAGVDFLQGLWQGKPGAPVDFGEFLGLSRAGRPFQGKGVASESFRVSIAFAGKGLDEFTAFLLKGC